MAVLLLLVYSWNVNPAQTDDDTIQTRENAAHVSLGIYSYADHEWKPLDEWPWIDAVLINNECHLEPFTEWSGDIATIADKYSPETTIAIEHDQGIFAEFRSDRSRSGLR